ncbi:hypothetical protein SRRS_11140 [Sporomusa rhizae]|uniref:OmpH family outer membrane protein n=1 Tax=Sporomusa rhizae TaxID=357999 RepID=UPI00352A7391
MKKSMLSFLFYVVCVFGLLGVGTVPAEAKDSYEPAYVNLLAVYAAHPDVNEAGKIILEEQKKAQQEYDVKAPSLDAKGKADLEKELNQRLARKETEIMQPIRESVVQAIAKVAKDKGIGYVVKAEEMLYGGTDLTKDVITSLKQK